MPRELSLVLGLAQYFDHKDLTFHSNCTIHFRLARRHRCPRSAVGPCQGTLVIGKMEVRVPVMHVIVDTELKNFLRLVGVNELPRIHLPVLKIQNSRG